MAADDDHSTGSREPRHRLRQRFEVIRKLGHGTYGKVQLAVNKETGQEVAIKTIKKAKIENGQDLVRIRREIQIMSYVQHPHIIHIHEVFENKEKIVLVMQYASGGELYDYLKTRRGASEADSRRIFRQIVSAVYYCHKNKICHRDLKLENILLDERGNAKIADFGLSNVFSDDKFLHTFCGSPLYASPEIVKGKPYYGPEVDCWSLGVLLYTLIYGAMPFDGSNFRSLVRQISEGDYYEPKRKSDASGLIQHLLTVKPAKRATVADICDHWWVNLGYEHPLSQVAEDMANFSPINTDALLNLPQASRNEQCKSPRKQESRGANSPICGQPDFSQESNECKAAKPVSSKCHLNDTNYDVVNSDSVSCSDDSLVVNNIGPSKDIGVESNMFPSDCFHLVPDKNAVYKFGAKLPDKELSRNNQGNKKHIPEPEFSVLSNKLSMAEEIPNVGKSAVDETSCSSEILNKFSRNKVIHQKQRNIDVIASQDSHGKENPLEKSEVTATADERTELFMQSNTTKKFTLQQQTKNEASEEKSTVASNDKKISQRNVQSLKKTTLSKDNSMSHSEHTKTPEVSPSNASTLKISDNSISIHADKSNADEGKLIHQPVINNETKAENKTMESNGKYINQRNMQNFEENILPKDNSLQPSENNRSSEISQSSASTLKISNISTYINKSIPDEEKLINQPENKTTEKTKDSQNDKKSSCKRGPGKLVIPKFFEAVQTVEKPADNKKTSKPSWSISDAKKALENKPQEKKPIYIPTRRVSDARSKFEQKIESSQVSTLPRRASRQYNTLREDLSTCSLSSLKSDQRRDSELDGSFLKDASGLDIQKPSCIENSCEESNVMQTHEMPEKEVRVETENSDNDQAKKTSMKPDINEIYNTEGNEVATDNPSKNISAVSSLYEDTNSGSQNKKDTSDKEALETITKVSSTSLDMESAPITQNHYSTIISSEQNSSVEESKKAAYQSKYVIDIMEEQQQQQHKCNFHEGTTSTIQAFRCENKETSKENKNIEKNLSELAQEDKTATLSSIIDKQDPDIFDKEKITSNDYHKEQTEENKINNIQTINNDSGNCSDNEIRPPSKAQTINDQSSGYISENQSLIGGEEQDTNEGTKLDLLKTFMEQECFPLNALLQNGYDHPHEVPHHAHQKESFSNTVSMNNDVELRINNLPLQTREPHQSRRRHSDAQSFMQSSDNQTTFGLRDISDLPESCYDDMLRLLNSRDAIRNKCSTSSVLSKHRHSRHTTNKDQHTRIQHWIKSEQRNGHSTDKDSSDNDDDFDIHLDYSYPVSSVSNAYQNMNTVEDTLAPVQYSTQLPTASRPVSHTGYRLTDEFSSTGNYKCSSLSNEEIENLIGIPSRNMSYVRRHSHTMRYKDPFLTDITSRYTQNPVFHALLPGCHHSNNILREQLKTRPNVAELYGTLRRRSCKSDILEFPEQRDGFYPSNSISRKSLHIKQNASFGRDTPNTERIRRNYARSLSLDIPDMPHHPARTNCETNPQMHIPQNYTADSVQRQNSDNLHLEDNLYGNNVPSNYPTCVNSNPSQNSCNINSELNKQFSGETKISEDIMQCEINKLEPNIKDSCRNRKLSECVESLCKSEHSLLQQDMLAKPDGNVGSISVQDLSTCDRKHEKTISLPSMQTKPAAFKASSLSLLEALKMQGYKNVIAQNLNFGSSITDSTSFDRFRSTDEQECVGNLQNSKEQENFMEEKNVNASTKLSNEHPNLVFPINYEFPQYENQAFQQSNSKQQLATVRESNESLSCKLDSDQEESVSERIWRKSFYSRFNDSHSKRRKSYREGDLKAQSISGSNWDILMEDNFKEDVLSRRRSSLTLGSSYSSSLPRSGIKPIVKQRSCGSEISDPLLQINDSSMIHKSSYRQKCNKRSSSLEMVENVSEDSSSFPVQKPTHSIAADRDLLYTTSIAESSYNRLYGTLKSSTYCNNNRQMLSQVREGEDCRSGTNVGGILPRRRYSTFDGYLYVQKTPTLAEPISSLLDSTNAENYEFS